MPNLTIEELRKIRKANPSNWTQQQTHILDLAISLLEQREGLKKKVEGMKMVPRSVFWNGDKDASRQHDEDVGYNAALSDVLALLNEKPNE